MSDYQRKQWEDLDVTTAELDRISVALKNDEFKKLFFDYCEEIQDPENRKIYEQELTQLEAERGVQITFLNPEPGFVVKTSVDGKIKGFINISKSDKVAKPVSEVKLDGETGKKGLNWSIPYAQAPPRYDYDNQKRKCLVYDVLFHPDAIRLAENNENMKKHVVSVACDAIEREFKVRLDQSNLKYPKMKFKGTPRASVVRKISEVQPEADDDPNPINKFMPPIPKADEAPKVYKSVDKKTDAYATPKYIIKHRRGIDLAEMTDELDAKLNLTVPKELVVEIELPMLKTSTDSTLDVTEKSLYLISEKPAKYKLRIDLPYEVNSKEGAAKFDVNTRKLAITLPVCSERQRKLKDLYREDSGVESDIREENSIGSPDEESMGKPLIEVLESKHFETQISETEQQPVNIVVPNFLNDNIEYNFPTHFDCNQLDEKLVFVLHVRNVDPESIENFKTENSIHLKFLSMGSGCYPIHYSFFCKLQAQIESIETEAWDNNVILTLNLCDFDELRTYSAGLNDDATTQIYQIDDTFDKFHEIQKENTHETNNDKIEISVKKCPEMHEIEIDIKPRKNRTVTDSTEEDNKSSGKEERSPSSVPKKHKKKQHNNKKRRSYSESYCDDIKSNTESETASVKNGEKNINSGDQKMDGGSTGSAGRKVRSFSESRSPNECTQSFKGILKHYSRYGRSMSDSCSSMDDNYSCSADMMRQADSFSDIPEEDTSGTNNDGESLSESCKKTVRFNTVIQKQLFRLDSSILGQRKKNQKRKTQKQRALQRRNSEGDSADYDDKSSPPESSPDDKHSNDNRVVADLFKTNKNSALRKHADSESSDIECKNNNLMFHMDL